MVDKATPARARALRRRATDAEAKLWSRLRNRQLAATKFRRQHPIGPYVVDLVCVDARLVVEVDGGQHADNPADRVRTAFLEAAGWRVVRYWNTEVLTNLDGVLEHLRAEVAAGRRR